jgi:hypothetical protein
VDEAIAAVTAGVKRLAKDEKNQHGGYQFAGIDAFLEMTGKLCGEAGLNIIMDEAEFEIIDEFFSTRNGMVAGLRMKFHITLSKEGEQKGPYTRSIIVPANMGAQAFGAAQSYVLKQFERATFQIPTGDKGEDIDAHDTGTITAGSSLNPDPSEARKPPKKLEGKHKTKESLKQAWNTIVDKLKEAADGGDPMFVDEVLRDWAEDIEQIKNEGPKSWMDNKDWGLSAQIQKARDDIANGVVA